MDIGIIEIFNRIHRLGRAMHPGFSPNILKHHVILLVYACIHFKDIRKWYGISDNPLLKLAIKRFPLMDGMIYWPYINYTWKMGHRLSVIDQHYRMLDGLAAIITHATFNDVELARVENEYAGLRLVLDKTVWFLREGEIVLNLFINDQRLYSVTFTLGSDEGLPLAYVGALQGSNSESAKEIYRDVTHALHGMRPRDFLLVSLKLLCLEVGISRLLAVSSEFRQHNSPYFGGSHKDKVIVDYDEVWIEHGGKVLDNGFFEIPVIVKFKDMNEIPSRKRATYRRRYQMLDRLAKDIRSNCEHYAGQTSEIIDNGNGKASHIVEVLAGS